MKAPVGGFMVWGAAPGMTKTSNGPRRHVKTSDGPFRQSYESRNPEDCDKTTICVKTGHGEEGKQSEEARIHCFPIAYGPWPIAYFQMKIQRSMAEGYPPSFK
jgi:hypothetical protein